MSGSQLERLATPGNFLDQLEDLRQRIGRIERYFEGGGGASDHGELDGLDDDDHSLYLTTSRHAALTGDGDLHVPKSHSHDHGGLSGLGDDDHTQYLLASGARAGAASEAQEFSNGIKVGGDLQVLRGGTSYSGYVLKECGQIGTASTVTLTTSYQTLLTTTLTVPTGGGYLIVLARVHIDQGSYGGTHLESRIVVDGSLKDYARERSVNVNNIEYNTPLQWIGAASGGSVTVVLQCRKNVDSGSFSVTSDPRTAMFYALFI